MPQLRHSGVGGASLSLASECVKCPWHLLHPLKTDRNLLKFLEVAKRTNYSEDRGLKVRFPLAATIAFETFELILCQMLSSQGKNAPSNPYPHYLVRLATSRLRSLDSSCPFFLSDNSIWGQ